MEYFISINQFVDFSKGTESKKKRIIRQQKEPNKFMISLYQTSRASIKKSLANNGDNKPIIEGLERLKSRMPVKPRQILNKTISIEAIQRYMKIKIPSILRNHKIDIIKKPKIKSIFIEGVEVLVSPDVIFTIIYNEEKYIGGIKIHISKRNVFSLEDSQKVSFLIEEYLKVIGDDYGAKILPELCFSLDVFDGRMISSPKNKFFFLEKIKDTAREIKTFWKVA
ncbi:hypothetical protein WH52_04730 [Tenacibaculum holothuriorum]|uniref:Uncharacterized protein n=1 Tax=Tenacibaculum holothuriorum TaxID=1635173 RepID=A0A1Y2PG37_9FLAO|nr:hypothetical protein [Tenacibaculum holothuriorum]OSY88971.1 hypothetical protein WH52_04730 [Tenacibaculum holothuriorum]